MRACLALLLITACGTPTSPAPAAQVDPPPADHEQVAADPAEPAQPDVPTAAPTADARAPDALVERGRALVEKFECNRCHTTPGPPAAAEKQCVGCHQKILAGEFDASPKVLARWSERIVHLRATPGLETLDGRVRRSWIRDYLLDPTDQRPHLEASMPRLPITPDEAEAIAAYLAPSAPKEAQLGDPVAGAAAYEAAGCDACHGGAVTASPDPAVALAPGLDNLRAKYHPAGLVQWIDAPSGAMPRIPTDAPAVAAYLLERRETPAPVKQVPARLPLLERRVRYAEIEEMLFLDTCWHCHSEPDLARGDGGPGNTGGFGFPRRGLSLASYAAMASGSVDDNGRRQSIYRKTASGDPLLVAVLRARQLEEAGTPVEGLIGMPLGLPAVTAEELQLVETWIAQGRRR